MTTERHPTAGYSTALKEEANPADEGHAEVRGGSHATAHCGSWCTCGSTPPALCTPFGRLALPSSWELDSTEESAA